MTPERNGQGIQLNTKITKQLWNILYKIRTIPEKLKMQLDYKYFIKERKMDIQGSPSKEMGFKSTNLDKQGRK